MIFSFMLDYTSMLTVCVIDIECLIKRVPCNKFSIIEVSVYVII